MAMKQLIYHMALQSILQHAAAEGRKEALFGRGYEHAKDVLPAFIRGDTFPHIQLEFPLAGDPFWMHRCFIRRIPEESV